MINYSNASFYTKVSIRYLKCYQTEQKSSLQYSLPFYFPTTSFIPTSPFKQVSESNLKNNAVTSICSLSLPVPIISTHSLPKPPHTSPSTTNIASAYSPGRQYGEIINNCWWWQSLSFVQEYMARQIPVNVLGSCHRLYRLPDTGGEPDAGIKRRLRGFGG